MILLAACAGLAIGTWVTRKKKEEGEEGYWLMEDGYWFLYQGQWKSCDGGRSWLRIGERWESPEERERRLRDLVEIRSEEGDDQEAGDQEEEEAEEEAGEEEEEEPERSSAEPEEEEAEEERQEMQGRQRRQMVVQGEPVPMVQVLQKSPPFRRPDLRPPLPAAARQQQAAAAKAAAAAFAKAAAREQMRKEDAMKTGLRSIAETKIIDCKAKNVIF